MSQSPNVGSVAHKPVVITSPDAGSGVEAPQVELVDELSPTAREAATRLCSLRSGTSVGVPEPAAQATTDAAHSLIRKGQKVKVVTKLGAGRGKVDWGAKGVVRATKNLGGGVVGASRPAEHDQSGLAATVSPVPVATVQSDMTAAVASVPPGTAQPDLTAAAAPASATNVQPQPAAATASVPAATVQANLAAAAVSSKSASVRQELEDNPLAFTPPSFDLGFGSTPDPRVKACGDTATRGVCSCCLISVS
ncbi:uncharacterized protein LOC112269386 [Brachypodium distachyon]|uniref:uncharacterized protein LOC112269386 n=1 Tax=Brachypodium distachyon TaxID=15368 RepID=UPI000D0D3BCB|nr:uncharacterized protein LOC112269386 [Brachypodium distachyon]|eukprot:XP_024311829.1 uncharacterized protein LOC112269386 [Brachypodium distachyon]